MNDAPTLSSFTSSTLAVAELGFGQQFALQTRRWLPGRDLGLVASSSLSSLLFVSALGRRGLTVSTRLRLDAPRTIRLRRARQAPQAARAGPERA